MEMRYRCENIHVYLEHYKVPDICAFIYEIEKEGTYICIATNLWFRHMNHIHLRCYIILSYTFHSDDRNNCESGCKILVSLLLQLYLHC